MAAGNASVRQDEFGGGIFRGRNAPRGSVYDAVNALVNDERELSKRGGDAYFTTSNFTGLGLGFTMTIAGPRLLVWHATDLRVVDGTTPVSLPIEFAIGLPRPFARLAAVSDIVVLPMAPVTGYDGFWAVAYAGSKKTTWSPITTITPGSAVVTVSAGGVLANADVGMFLQAKDGATILGYRVVKRIISNTQVELTEAWEGAAPTDGVFMPTRAILPVQLSSIGTNPDHEGFVASAGYRALYGYRNRVAFSPPTDPLTVENDHELPISEVITGMEGVGNQAVIFTTAGVWLISNLDLDALDPFGNIQHTVQQINKDVLLWGDPGIAAWGGALVVPAIDDVYVMTLDGASRPISEAIRPLYRSYIAAGYKPGTASVHRGHYFLPILDGSNALVDELVCRLDLRDRRGTARPAWTRWEGHAAARAWALQLGSTTREPRLFGVSGARVAEMTDCFDVPMAATEADGTVPVFEVIGSDFEAGVRATTVISARARYEMEGAGATVTLEHAAGEEGAAFTAATVVRGGGESDGDDFSAWRVARRATKIRLRFRSTSAVTKLALRGLEVLVRPIGRQ